MNRLLIFVGLCTFLSFGLYAQKVEGISMTFKNEHLDIGKIKKGEKRTFDFEFTNTGTEDLRIAIVSGCDCTTLDWPRRAIKPGDSAMINVIFDSTEKEESETVDVDIYLKNLDPKTGEQYLKIVDYKFELIE